MTDCATAIQQVEGSGSSGGGGSSGPSCYKCVMVSGTCTCLSDTAFAGYSPACDPSCCP